MTTEIKRAFRFALDVGPTEIVILQRYATASRCAFNFAHAFFLAADQMWQRGRDALIAAGMNRSEANAKAPKVKRPAGTAHRHSGAKPGVSGSPGSSDAAA
ncbi:hypothetical protein ACFQL8_26815 [Streptomyces goshikiensis]|uniref:hypothetical protein n=1 Tax=Streptomyces goshikiensis TaxID=1942 RepID=UPI0016759BA2|nr:hypothetical protein [Streptomyces goshikiensis]GHD76229.1 hypothetical protein GCM10010336_53630 [Streptomyces goshikiensis]